MRLSPESGPRGEPQQLCCSVKALDKGEDLNASWKWQSGSFDRLMRTDESLQNKWLYLQENPVRAGLVTRWEDWPFRIGFDEPAL